MIGYSTYLLPCVVTLGGVSLGLWLGLRRRMRLTRRARRLLPTRVGPPIGTAEARSGDQALRVVRRALAKRPRWLVPELSVLPAGLLLGELTGSIVPPLAAAGCVVPLRRWRLRRRTAAEARHRAAAVIGLCEAVAAELRSGATPEQALHIVMVREGLTLRHRLGAEPAARLAAVRYGADVPAALRLVAELPGGRGAAAVAACWQVAADRGSGLASGLDQVADALRAERALAEEIAGELAGPRTTIGLLALLPLVGLAIGSALGARPAHILLHTPGGLACLTIGGALELAGLAWTSRIVRAAEDAPDARPGSGHAPPPAQAPGPVIQVGPWAGCGITRIRPGRGAVT